MYIRIEYNFLGSDKLGTQDEYALSTNHFYKQIRNFGISWYLFWEYMIFFPFLRNLDNVSA